MSKITKIVLFLVLIVVIYLGYRFYPSTRGQQSFVDSKVAQTYPILRDKTLWTDKEIHSDNQLQWEVPDLGILKAGENDSFYCGNKKVNLVKYSSNRPPAGAIGGWESVYVVDCGSKYFIYYNGDGGQLLFGPFEKDK